MGSITLRWIEDHLFTGTDSNGHSVVIGRSPEGENPWVGLKPSEMLLMAAASCAAWDVVSILKKQKEPLQDLRITCSGEQILDPPWTFSAVHLHYVVVGMVNPDRLSRAIRLAEDKYCAVIGSLRPTVEVTSGFEIIVPSSQETPV